MRPSSSLALQVNLVIDLGCRLVDQLPIPGEAITDLILAQRGYFEELFLDFDREIELGVTQYESLVKQSQETQMILMDEIKILEKKLFTLPPVLPLYVPTPPVYVPTAVNVPTVDHSESIVPDDSVKSSSNVKGHVGDLIILKEKLQRQVAELQNLRIMRNRSSNDTLRRSGQFGLKKDQYVRSVPESLRMGRYDDMGRDDDLGIFP